MFRDRSWPIRGGAADICLKSRSLGTDRSLSTDRSLGTGVRKKSKNQVI